MHIHVSLGKKNKEGLFIIRCEAVVFCMGNLMRDNITVLHIA